LSFSLPNPSLRPFHCCAATMLPVLQQHQADEDTQSPHPFESVLALSVYWTKFTAPPKVELSVLPSYMTYAATTCCETHPGELPTPLRPRWRKWCRKRSLVERGLVSPASSVRAAMSGHGTTMLELLCHREILKLHPQPLDCIARAKIRKRGYPFV
jgi:hypothetical protein